nr:MAG TPA: hypothetical protein [Caudoviricetes sp.]DAG41591.1 MAG TPA: hypothetical protein [Caudoviricetes sp.]
MYSSQNIFCLSVSFNAAHLFSIFLSSCLSILFLQPSTF